MTTQACSQTANPQNYLAFAHLLLVRRYGFDSPEARAFRERRRAGAYGPETSDHRLILQSLMLARDHRDGALGDGAGI